MNWSKENNKKLTSIDELSIELPAISDSLDAFWLPEIFKQLNTDTLPVINIKGEIIGIVSEYDLTQSIPEWSIEEESYKHNLKVSEIMTENVWTETEKTNVKDILFKIKNMHRRVIPIIDENKKYTGKVITRSSLISYLTSRVKPRSIGGLATPMGVYMTDGIHQSGSKNAGLVSTGISLALVVTIAQILTVSINSFLNLTDTLTIFLQLTIFVLLLRITPLVKYHAAEHQTIHAIEKGLPLSIDTVKMQKRAHIRCGTNLMILFMGIQLIILFSYEILNLAGAYAQFIFMIFSFWILLKHWKKTGMWVQNKLTTATAGNNHLQSGIKAGKELLQLNNEDFHSLQPNFLQKIWNMGVIQVLTSFLATLWIVEKIINILW